MEFSFFPICDITFTYRYAVTLITTEREFHKHSIWNVLNFGIFFLIKNPKPPHSAGKSGQTRFCPYFNYHREKQTRRSSVTRSQGEEAEGRTSQLS